MTDKMVCPTFDRMLDRPEVPLSITVNDGTKFLSWCSKIWIVCGIQIDFNRLGKSTEKAFIYLIVVRATSIW